MSKPPSWMTWMTSMPSGRPSPGGGAPSPSDWPPPESCAQAESSNVSRSATILINLVFTFVPLLEGSLQVRTQPRRRLGKSTHSPCQGSGGNLHQRRPAAFDAPPLPLDILERHAQWGEKRRGGGSIHCGSNLGH